MIQCGRLWPRRLEKGVFLPTVSAPRPRSFRTGSGSKMTDGQFYRYQQEVGRLYRERLERDLDRFKDMSPEEAANYLKGFSVLRERARAVVAAED
jgi:hypothetical protein